MRIYIWKTKQILHNSCLKASCQIISIII